MQGKIFLPRSDLNYGHPISTGRRSMDNAEVLDFVSTTDASEPEYQARHVGRAKYAIVLSGERDEVVGWRYDEESAIKVAQALNLAKGGSQRAGHLVALSAIAT
jgi:hypothetical protein